MEFTVNKVRRVVEFVCMKCNGKLACPFNEAGTTQNCPDCGTALLVPGKQEVEAVQQEEQRRAQQRKLEVESIERLRQQEEAERARFDETQRAAAARFAVEAQRYAGARKWGDALHVIGILLIVLGGLALGVFILVLFAGAPNSTLSSYSPEDVSRAYAQEAQHRAAVTSGIISSLGAVYAGCAFAGLGQTVLLLRRITVVLEDSRRENEPSRGGAVR